MRFVNVRDCFICNAQLDDIPLDEGRCPHCGSQLEWQESPRVDVHATTPFSPPKKGVKTSLIETLWKESIVSDSNLNGTIKSHQSEIAVTDSVYSIQRREIVDQRDVEFGRTLDYELLEVIGEGGVGIVYAARQASIDRKVAIKMLRNEFRVRSEHRNKFLAEAVLTGELDHPNIVPIYDLGSNQEGELFYAMKNVVGTPWDRVVQSHSLDLNLEILHKVADAVAFAHSRGVIHRDLKPENVMLGEFGEVLVMDWGIAMPTEGFNKSSSILRTQAMGGTPAYMAPELASGPVERIGKASDVYLLGAILFEILTGKPPHTGVDVLDCVMNAANNVIVETDKSGELMDIARKAMELIPGRRYRSVRDFQKAIRRYESHRESLVLLENAELEFANAMKSESYSAFNRALFAFGESLKLWGENIQAQQGLSRARLAYAEVAYKKEDFDLGLSILEEEDDETAGSLISKLKQGQADRSARMARLKTIRRLAFVLGLFILVTCSVGTCVILVLYSRSATLNESLLFAQKNLQSSVEAANEARARAETQREIAVEQHRVAETQTRVAESARRIADIARIESANEKRKADESSYFAEIGLIGASIKQNSFMIASSLLDGIGNSSAKAKLRHWEWGRYQYLVHGGTVGDSDPPVKTLPLSDDIECIDTALDGQVTVYGLSNGDFGIINVQSGQSVGNGKHGSKIYAVAIDSTGQCIATSGWSADEGFSLRLWSFVDGKLEGQGTTLPENSCIQSIHFHPNPAVSQLATGGAKKSIKIWDWKNRQVLKTFVGHLEEITCVKISPDGNWVASGSNDSTVRLWDIHPDQNGISTEVQRFSMHKNAVNAIDFSPNGNLIVSGDSSGSLLLWQVSQSRQGINEVLTVQRALQGEPAQDVPHVRLSGHQSSVNGVDFSGDGEQIVSCGSDNLVLSWRLNPDLLTEGLKVEHRIGSDGKGLVLPEASYRGHGGWVRGCKFLSRGLLLSGGDDGTLKVWNPELYREQTVLQGNGVPALNGRVSPDMKTVAASYLDGTIRLWSLENGKELGVLREGHEYLTNAAQLINDKNTLITAAGDNTLRIWDVNSGTETAVVQQSGRNARFAVSRNGKRLVATGDSSGIPLWDLESNREIERLVSDRNNDVRNIEMRNRDEATTFREPRAIAIADTGDWIAAGDHDGNVSVWFVRGDSIGSAQRFSRDFKGHQDSIIGCYFLPQDGQEFGGQSVLTLSTDGSMAQWRVTEDSHQLVGNRIQTFGALQASAISEDGKFIACSAPLSKKLSRLWVYEIATGELIQQKDLTDAVIQDLQFDGDNQSSLLLTYSIPERTAKTAARLDIQTGEVVTSVVGGAQSASFWGMLSDSERNRLVTYGGRGARVWDTYVKRLATNFRPNRAVSKIAYSPDGKTLVSGSVDGTIQLWSVEELRCLRQLERIHASEIQSLHFSSDAKTLLTASRDGWIVFWNLESSSPRLQAKLPRNLQPTACAWSQDEKSLWVATVQGAVLKLDVSNLEIESEFQAHKESVTCIALSGDGQFLATGSIDKLISVWSAREKSKIADFLGHSASISSLEFSADGLRLLSSSKDTMTSVWDARSIYVNHVDEVPRQVLGELIALGHHRLPVNLATFSNDGRIVLSVGEDGDCVLWYSDSIPPQVGWNQEQLYVPNDNNWIELGQFLDSNVPNVAELANVSIELQGDSSGENGLELALGTMPPNWEIVDERILVKDNMSEMAPSVLIATFSLLEGQGKLAIRPTGFMKPNHLKELMNLVKLRLKTHISANSASLRVDIRVVGASGQEVLSESRIGILPLNSSIPEKQ